MHSHPPKIEGSGLTLLPFGGLGLDLAEVRREALTLALAPLPRGEERLPAPCRAAPASPCGYRLLVRLGRETLGS